MHPDALPLKRGDVDGNGEIDINDVTLFIDYVLGRNPSGFVVEAADIAIDGAIDVNDVTALIDILLAY